MKYSSEIKLKEQKEPTLWERFTSWLNGGASEETRPAGQLPQIGTNTEILLSQSQAKHLKAAVESPLLERTSDTTSVRRADSGDSLMI